MQWVYHDRHLMLLNTIIWIYASFPTNRQCRTSQRIIRKTLHNNHNAHNIVWLLCWPNLSSVFYFLWSVVGHCLDFAWISGVSIASLSHISVLKVLVKTCPQQSSGNRTHLSQQMWRLFKWLSYGKIRVCLDSFVACTTVNQPLYNSS